MAVSFHNSEVLRSIRSRKKQQPKQFFGITYTVNKCKGGKFGVYVKALSGEALQSLSTSNPAFKRYYIPVQTMPDNWSIVNGLPIYSIGAIPVLSGRIARKNSEKQAIEYMERLINAPKDYQLQVCGRLRLLPIPKGIKLVRLQYYRFTRMFRGEFLPSFSTSQDAKGTEKLAINYAGNNIPAKLTPTIARTIAIPIGESHTGNEVKVTAKGLKGFTKDIKDQTPEYLRRMHQKRKRTTTVQYWKNKR